MCNYKDFLLMVFVSFTFTVSGQQNRFIGGILLNVNGIEFNGNTSRFWNSSRSTTRIDGTLGYSAGLFVKGEFTNKIYSTLEFRYLNKGSIYEYINEYSTQSFETLFLNYIELPILFGYKIKPRKRIYYFDIGFAYAKMISSNINANDLLKRLGTPNANAFKSYDISWIASLKFPVTKKWKDNLLLGLRISRSILTIHNYYKLYNFDYGVELDYVFNNK